MFNKKEMEDIEELDDSISPEIRKAVDDAQKLIAYIAWNGNIVLDEAIISNLIEAKYQVSSGNWNAEIESKFWMDYDKLAKMVYPVTIQSLNSTMPVFANQSIRKLKQQKTKADKAVRWYRIFTFFSLIALLVTQVYWIVGSDLNHNLNKIFDERENLRKKLVELTYLNQNSSSGPLSVADLPTYQLQEEEQILNQKLDANYELLRYWNKVWLFGHEFDGKLADFFGFQYRYNIDQAEKNSKEWEKLLLDSELDKARNKLFLNMLSAKFVLAAFQGYILPLLYGLLGAFIFVLRTLAREIKDLTYSFDSEISYRLRLTLGSLAGMIVGWFLRADSDSMIVSLSPMAIAFLMGYNVDILFSIMDRFIMNITKWIQQDNMDNDEPQRNRRN